MTRTCSGSQVTVRSDGWQELILSVQVCSMDSSLLVHSVPLDSVQFTLLEDRRERSTASGTVTAETSWSSDADDDPRVGVLIFVVHIDNRLMRRVLIACVERLRATSSRGVCQCFGASWTESPARTTGKRAHFCSGVPLLFDSISDGLSNNTTVRETDHEDDDQEGADNWNRRRQRGATRNEGCLRSGRVVCMGAYRGCGLRTTRKPRNLCEYAAIARGGGRNERGCVGGCRNDCHD